MSKIYSRLEKCYNCFKSKINFTPDIALVLGSGLGDYVDGIEIRRKYGSGARLWKPAVATRQGATVLAYNMKRENITPMEKARAYQMKLEAMKRKAGRRSKTEILSGEKPMRADEQLAQQTGESRSNIQKLVRLNNLTPELQQMVEEKKLPVHTAAGRHGRHDVIHPIPITLSIYPRSRPRKGLLLFLYQKE